MTRLALALPPGYAALPGPGADRTAMHSVFAANGSDPAELDPVLDALAAESAHRGVVTSGALALDGSATAWLTVTVTALPGGPVDADVVPGMIELLRTRHPAAEVREVPLPAGPAVRVEQRGSLELPGGRVDLVDVRHLLPLSGGEAVVTVAVQATDVDAELVGSAAGSIARGLRIGERHP